MPNAPVLVVDRIEISEGRLDAVVLVPDEANFRTSRIRDLPRRLLGVLPGLARHRCENDASRSFTDELADTETPHLLEHVTEELMALSGSPRWLKGETTWDFACDGRGVFHVALAYDDDLAALGALKEGVAVVDWLFDAAAAPDIDAAVARLRSARRALAADSDPAKRAT